MERHGALAGGHAQLLAHRLAVRVLGQLQIVDARHDRWQIVVGTLVEIERLADNGQRWIERLEAAGGQTRRTGDELQQHALLLFGVGAHDVEQIVDGLGLAGEAVVGATALLKHANVPPLVVARAGAAEHVLQFLRVEEAQPAGGEHRVESWTNKKKDHS